MRFAVWGLLVAAVLFLISGGHLLFLPLFFLLSLGGMFVPSGPRTPLKGTHDTN